MILPPASFITSSALPLAVDYLIGKSEGEDDQRALSGPAAGLAGAWAGGMAGGRYLKSIPGIIVGAGLGYLGGSYLGDRLDDGLRPDYKAQTLLNHHLQRIPTS